MVHPNSALNLTGEQIIRKCLTIKGIHNYAPCHLQAAVEFLVETVDQFPFTSLVSPPYSLKEFPEALQMAEKQEWYRVAVKPN